MFRTQLIEKQNLVLLNLNATAFGELILEEKKIEVPNRPQAKENRLIKALIFILLTLFLNFDAWLKLLHLET